jgi:hypothetical protein
VALWSADYWLSYRPYSFAAVPLSLNDPSFWRVRADETRRMAEQTEDFATPTFWGKDDVES